MIDSALKETEGAWGTQALLKALSLIVYLLLLQAPWEPFRQVLQLWYSQLTTNGAASASTAPLGALAVLIVGILLLAAHRVIRYLSPFLIAFLCGRFFPLSVLKRHFQAKQRRLAEKVKSRPQLIEELRLYYPESESEIQPSRLGNILRAAELYPLVRYDMEAIVLWPRLAQLISDRDMKNLEHEKDALLFFLELSFLTLTSALFWTIARPIWGFGPPPILILAAYVLGYGFYRLSLLPAVNYGRLIRVNVDLYRTSLLEALGQEVPENLFEEQKIWRKISAYLLTGDADDEALANLFVRPTRQKSDR